MAHRSDSLVIRSRVEDVRREAQKQAFVNALKRVGTVGVAAEIVGLNPQTFYRWRKDDPEFAEAWENAVNLAFESLESATYLKIAEVLKDPYKRISASEAVLIKMFLAGAKPEKYRERAIEIDQSQHFTIDWSSVPDEVMDQFTAGDLTLQDVYERTIQFTQRERSSPSTD